MRKNFTRLADNAALITASFDLVKAYDAWSGNRWYINGLPDRDSVIDDIHWTLWNVQQYILDVTYNDVNLANFESVLNDFKFGSASAASHEESWPDFTGLNTPRRMRNLKLLGKHGRKYTFPKEVRTARATLRRVSPCRSLSGRIRMVSSRRPGDVTGRRAPGTRSTATTGARAVLTIT